MRRSLGLACWLAVPVLCTGVPADAQPAGRLARVGLLCPIRCDVPAFDAFRDGLATKGWVEKRNLVIDARAAAGRFDQLPVLAREIAAAGPDVIVASTPQAARAAKDAAGAIPVVFIAVADPVAVGLVQSLARPGGNVTGFTTLAPGGFIAKSFDLIKELLPAATRVAVLVNPTNDVARIRFAQEGPSSAASIGVHLQMLEVREPAGIGPAIEAAARERADVLYVPGDPLFHTPAGRVPALTTPARLPTVFLSHEVVEAGGLMAYGPDFLDLYGRAAGHVDKILRGASPADLPVEQPTRYRLVVNLKTAAAIGVSVPQSLLVRADSIIR